MQEMIYNLKNVVFVLSYILWKENILFLIKQFKNENTMDAKQWFKEKYDVDKYRLDLIEHKGSDVIRFINEYINDNKDTIFRSKIIMKDIYGKPIFEGQRFKFKFLEELDKPIELIGSFDYNDEELRYEIDIHNNPDYICLSYVPNGKMYDFVLL
jgi:hypothetical protein